MAGNIQKVNLTNLKKEVNEYITLCIRISNDWYAIYKDMNKIPTFWTGKLANKTINVWNRNLSSIESNNQYFLNTVGDILGQILDQYQAMENGKPYDSKMGYATYLYGKQIPLTDESTIKFEQANVDAIIKDIESIKLNLHSKYKELIGKLDSMQAYSDSLRTLSITYKEKGNQLKATLDNIISSIRDEVNQYINYVKTTEAGYNEADVKRAK